MSQFVFVGIKCGCGKDTTCASFSSLAARATQLATKFMYSQYKAVT